MNEVQKQFRRGGVGQKLERRVWVISEKSRLNHDQKMIFHVSMEARSLLKQFNFGFSVSLSVNIKVVDLDGIKNSSNTVF
jgi:hypothetical protein